MKFAIPLTFVVFIFANAYTVRAENVTLIAPGGMRCAIDRMALDYERKTGDKIEATIGSGGATHQQVVKGEPFDVPIVQPPYEDVLASGNVEEASETPLATVAVVVVMRKGSPRPDIATPDAVTRMLLGAKSISYPNGASGAAAGVSFDATMKKLGIFDAMQAKIKRAQGVTLMQLLTRGDIDVVVTFASEIDDPGIEVIGPLPRAISTPTALVGFVSSRAKSPKAARALLTHLASSDAAASYKACGMQPGR